MAIKKTYYIEFGDGKDWWGTEEVESDMRHSNALQDGDPIKDETHGLMAALHIHDESQITVREAGDDPGFSNDPKRKVAILCARVWAEEEDEEGEGEG